MKTAGKASGVGGIVSQGEAKSAQPSGLLDGGGSTPPSCEQCPVWALRVQRIPVEGWPRATAGQLRLVRVAAVPRRGERIINIINIIIVAIAAVSVQPEQV
ncbi:unnamed protein product [Lampetra fluviatilis]